jgi:hypothetical protein
VGYFKVNENIMEKQVIEVYRREVYGVDRIYPACEKAEKILDLTGTKTFLPNHVETLRELGYILKVRDRYAVL